MDFKETPLVIWPAGEYDFGVESTMGVGRSKLCLRSDTIDPVKGYLQNDTLRIMCTLQRGDFAQLVQPKAQMSGLAKSMMQLLDSGKNRCVFFRIGL